MGRSDARHSRWEANSQCRTFIEWFVRRVLRRAGVSMTILLVTLVYVDRTKSRLGGTNITWTFASVFLGALVVATSKVCAIGYYLFVVDTQLRNYDSMTLQIRGT